MGYFNYPIDAKMLIRKKNKLKKELAQKNNLLRLKIAILGGSTTSEIAEQLYNFLLYHGIESEIYESDYGRYYEEALYDNERLNKFKPDIIYIHTNWRNINIFPTIDNTELEVNSMLDAQIQSLINMWETLKEKYKCPIIQNNFDRPNYRLLGNRDIWDYRGRSNYISRLNQHIYEYASSSDNFFINDLEYLAQEYGLSKWNDSYYWYMYKSAMNINAVPYVAQSIANIIKSLFGKNKKLLVVDLDNTLWEGIIGEDGISGIEIGNDTPQGQAFVEFQKYCKELQKIGIALAINSKNDLKNALDGLSHSSGILKKDDFVCIKANWQDKATNMKEISTELSLGVENFIFLDDNPVERNLVNMAYPSIETPEIDYPEQYINFIDRNGYFEVTNLSNEDRLKTDLYRARMLANIEKSKFKSYEEYLKGLEMKLIVDLINDNNVRRVTQLINKTNQFNLTAKKYLEDSIREMAESNKFLCVCGELIDKFIDNGIVTAIIGEIIEQELHIRVWVMSCRVFKRELEYAMLNLLVAEAKKKDIVTIIGYYNKTQKNDMSSMIYHDMGFENIYTDYYENSIWKLDISTFNPRKVNIDIKSRED